MADNSETLLKAILGTIGRQTFSPEKLAEIVMAGGAGEKQFRAFNLCNGTMTQGEIAKSVKLDSGNFSRTLSRWIDAGVVFRLGSGKEAKLLHVCPLAKGMTKKKAKKDD